jgi:hypothetical protein
VSKNTSKIGVFWAQIEPVAANSLGFASKYRQKRMKHSHKRTKSLGKSSDPDALGPPSAESAPSGRDRYGRFLPRNKDAVTHGGYAQPEDLPAPLRARLGDLDSFRQGLQTDQGDDAELTIVSGYIEKLTSVEGLYRLLAADVMIHGIFTPRRRTRSTFHALLATIEKWDRLAQRLGMGRKARDVGGLSIEDYVREQDREQQQQPPESADAPEAP